MSMRYTTRTLPAITSYAKAMEILGNRSRVNLANNTSLVQLAHGLVAVYLHDTPILTIMDYPDGIARLNVRSGGYRTVTTKQRLNKLLSGVAYIYQKNFVWYIVEQYGSQEFEHQFVEGFGLNGPKTL